jgi:hypothetical protein
MLSTRKISSDPHLYLAWSRLFLLEPQLSILLYADIILGVVKH